MTRVKGPRGHTIRAREVLKRVTDAEPVGVEVGVWRGQMSEELLRRAPSLFLYMVDPWVGEHQPRSGRSQDDLIAETKRRTASAEGRTEIVRLPSVEAAVTFEDASLDFVFIDGDHTYEAVVADIEAWLPKVRPGGLLCGHDYFPAHTTERGYGVVQAVDEACVRHGWTLELGENSTWFVQL